MRTHYLLLMFAFLLTLVVGKAVSINVPNLNQANIPVKSTSQPVTSAILLDALHQVLVKLSGNTAVMTVPAIRNTLGDLKQWIESYAYVKQAGPDGRLQLLLQITFDRKALKALLNQAKQGEWPSNRPLTLIWIRGLTHDESHVLSSTEETPWSNLTKTIASSRGLPILLPTMDLTDQSLEDSRQTPLDQAQLTRALNRYHADAIFAGDVTQTDHQWQGNWLMLLNGTPYQWHATAPSPNDLLYRAMNRMIDLMVNRLAITEDTDLQSDVTLVISHIENLKDYLRALSLIGHLKSVTSITVKEMQGIGSVVLALKVIGGETALIKALQLKPAFSVIADNDNHAVNLGFHSETTAP